jgi:hypothetical protein
LGELLRKETTPDEMAKQSKTLEGEMKEGLLKMMQHYDKYGFAGGNDPVLKTTLQREPCQFLII